MLLKFLIKKIITFFFKSHQLKMRLDQESILPASLLALPRALEFAFGFVNKWKGPNRSGRHRAGMWWMGQQSLLAPNPKLAVN